MSISKISVVMGVYNGAGRLAETIESVLRQTAADFEFIIVNDGSTDTQVGTILTDYARRDSRIKVICKSNEGLTRALIDGCAAAKGKFIARMDNGDVMLPNRLEKQRAVLDAYPEAVLVTCWTEYCGPDWEPLYTVRNIPPEGSSEKIGWVLPFPDDGDNRERLLGPTSHPSVMMRTEAYRKAGGYRAQFYYGQDWDLWYRLADIGRFAGVQEALYRCRIFPDGISMGNAERQRQIHACSRGAFLARRRGEDESPFLVSAASILPCVKNDNRREKKTLPASQVANGYYFIGETLRLNRDQRCRGYFWQALRRSPCDLRCWVRLGQSISIGKGA